MKDSAPSQLVLQKTLQVLLIAGISILVISFFIPRKAAFDLTLLDSYYILSKRTLYFASGLFLVLCYLVYRLNSRSPLMRWLVFAHLGLTVIPIIYVLSAIGGFNSEEPFITPQAETKIFQKLIFAFAAGQLLLLANLVIGLVRLTRKTAK